MWQSCLLHALLSPFLLLWTTLSTREKDPRGCSVGSHTSTNAFGSMLFPLAMCKPRRSHTSRKCYVLEGRRRMIKFPFAVSPSFSLPKITTNLSLVGETSPPTVLVTRRWSEHRLRQQTMGFVWSDFPRVVK
jgi:hypothetical protein